MYVIPTGARIGQAIGDALSFLIGLGIAAVGIIGAAGGAVISLGGITIGIGAVLRRIVRVSKAIMKPMISMGKDYELDEICNYVRKKTNIRWIVYAIRKDNKEVVDFAVGCRTTRTLKLVTDTLILSNAHMVYTDKLRQYATLLPMAIHWTTQYGTNDIERKNLSLRIHLKRLCRRTICFSRTMCLLRACLAIYFWG